MAGLVFGEVETVGGERIFVHLSEGTEVLADAAVLRFVGEVEAVEETDKVVPKQEVGTQQAMARECLKRAARNGKEKVFELHGYVVAIRLSKGSHGRYGCPAGGQRA